MVVLGKLPVDSPEKETKADTVESIALVNDSGVAIYPAIGHRNSFDLQSRVPFSIGNLPADMRSSDTMHMSRSHFPQKTLETKVVQLSGVMNSQTGYFMGEKKDGQVVQRVKSGVPPAQPLYSAVTIETHFQTDSSRFNANLLVESPKESIFRQPVSQFVNANPLNKGPFGPGTLTPQVRNLMPVILNPRLPIQLMNGPQPRSHTPILVRGGVNSNDPKLNSLEQRPTSQIRQPNLPKNSFNVSYQMPIGSQVTQDITQIYPSMGPSSQRKLINQTAPASLLTPPLIQPLYQSMQLSSRQTTDFPLRPSEVQLKAKPPTKSNTIWVDAPKMPYFLK